MVNGYTVIFWPVFHSANTRPFQLQVDLTAGSLAARFMTLVLRAVKSSTTDTLVPLSVRHCRITPSHAVQLRKWTMMLSIVRLCHYRNWIQLDILQTTDKIHQYCILKPHKDDCSFKSGQQINKMLCWSEPSPLYYRFNANWSMWTKIFDLITTCNAYKLNNLNI